MVFALSTPYSDLMVTKRIICDHLKFPSAQRLKNEEESDFLSCGGICKFCLKRITLVSW